MVHESQDISHLPPTTAERQRVHPAHATTWRNDRRKPGGKKLGPEEIWHGNGEKTWNAPSKKGDMCGEHGKIMEIFGKTLQFMGIQRKIGEKNIDGGLNGNILFIYVICSIAIY